MAANHYQLLPRINKLLPADALTTTARLVRRRYLSLGISDGDIMRVSAATPPQHDREALDALRHVGREVVIDRVHLARTRRHGSLIGFSAFMVMRGGGLKTGNQR